MSIFTSAGEYASADFIYGDGPLDRKLLGHLPSAELDAADQHAARVLDNVRHRPDVDGQQAPRAEELRAAIATIRTSQDRSTR
jgi:hypothetical protein